MGRFDGGAGMSAIAAPMRERVQRLEDILALTPQADCPVRMIHSPGLCAREMVIPAGVMAVGAVHKVEHISTVYGHCWVTTDDGVKEIHGHATFVTKPGMKRALCAIESTVFTTFHPNPTDERDIGKLCEMFTESAGDELLGSPANRQLANQKEALCLGE